MADQHKVRTVNIFLGFFFVVNFCLGTGFLGVPYAFFYSGILVSLCTLTLVAAISWTNANFLLEVMARAQVRDMASGSRWGVWAIKIRREEGKEISTSGHKVLSSNEYTPQKEKCRVSPKGKVQSDQDMET